MRSTKPRNDNRTKRELDLYSGLLHSAQTTGRLGRIRFASSRGFGFVLELDNIGNPTGAELFFHGKVMVASNHEHPWEVFERVMSSSDDEKTGSRSDVRDDNTVDTEFDWGPLVKFVASERPSPKGPACAVVWLLNKEEAAQALPGRGR